LRRCPRLSDGRRLADCGNGERPEVEIWYDCVIMKKEILLPEQGKRYDWSQDQICVKSNLELSNGRLTLVEDRATGPKESPPPPHPSAMSTLKNSLA